LRISNHKTLARNKRVIRQFAAVTLLAVAMPVLTGCVSLFTSKRILPAPLAPEKVQTATADQLVATMNEKWSKFESLTATVDVVASRLKSKEGTATDYPSFRANLLLKKPNMLRILGKLPVVQTTMFDLGSDGKNFTLVVPHNNKAYQGQSDSKGTSPNWYENLRPGSFFTAMTVRGVEKEELYSVTAEDITQEDASNKRLLMMPEYELSIVRRKPDSQELYPVRIVRFHRDDLLPYEQDLYDDKGTLETQVLYAAYQDFGGFQYPSKVTLKRPLEEYQLVMTVERVTSNPPLTDDQFQVKIPTGYATQTLQ
jgi:outer membrane lipoprotein-sorting protein